MASHYRVMSLLTASALAMGWSVPALAQAGADEASRSGDIIVTARRVEERLQDVPISITVFNQEQITKENISSGRELAQYTPSLSTNSRYGNDFASFAIRGFTQEPKTAPSVGVYFADVVVPRSSGSIAQSDGAAPGLLFDLENVQVLKGPQGTLFGRNTTGGAIVLVPRRPTDRIEGYVEGSAGNYNMWRLQGVINLPVSDSIKIRAGVDWQDREGYLKNTAPVGPRHFGDVEYVAARLSILADITPDIENYTVATYTKSTPNGMIPKVTDCFNGPNSLLCQQLNRERGQPLNRVSGWLPWQYQSSKIWQVSNSTKWVVSDSLTVKNIASYGESVQDQAMDLFGTGVQLGPTFSIGNVTTNVAPQFIGAYVGSATSISPPGLHAGAQRTFTEELQFIGTSLEGRLRWQAGAYYERSKPMGWSGTQSMQFVICDSQQQWATFSCTDLTGAIGGFLRTGGGVLTPGLNLQSGQRNRQVTKSNFRNLGLYAQASFDMTPWLTLDAGFRYTWDKAWAQGSQLGPEYSAATNPPWAVPTFKCLVPGLVYAGTIESCRLDVKQSSKAPTWVLALNFKPVDDVLLYAKYSRGYRQGSVNATGAIGFMTFEPEKVDVYEVGLKTSFDGPVRGSFNISGFYNDFQDMQLQVAFLDLFNNLPPNLPPVATIVNAGKSRILGLEIEASINPFEGFTLQAGYSYLDTKLKALTTPDLSGQPVGYYDFVASLPLVGKRLPYSAKTKLTVNATYRLPVPETAGRVTIGATYVRTGSIYNSDASLAARTFSIFDPSSKHYNPLLSPAFSLMNFNANWDNIGESPVSAAVFITNAFNKKYFASVSPSGGLGASLRYLGEPRMYGMRLKYSF